MASKHSADVDAQGASPERMCAVTRRHGPVESLLRFVAAPDGTLVPDLSCNLPGRGVWVALDRRTVASAVKTKAFSRSLKREVSVAADLADLVDRLLIERALSALSLANKAGLVFTGFTKIDAGIAGGTVYALLHGIGGSADGVEKLDRRYRAMCRDSDLPPQILQCFTIEQMSLALGRANVVHAALMKGGAAQHLLAQAERVQAYRTVEHHAERHADEHSSAAPAKFTKQGQA